MDFVFLLIWILFFICLKKGGTDMSLGKRWLFSIWNGAEFRAPRERQKIPCRPDLCWNCLHCADDTTKTCRQTERVDNFN